MPNVLTAKSAVLCGQKDPTTGAHGGAVQVQSTAKLTVGNAPVLLLSSINGKPIPPTLCGTVLNTNQGNKPCSTVTAVTAGAATKLTVGAAPVMLDGLTGTTDGTLAGVLQAKLTATAGQTKLSSI
jgi:hypothetical protein